MSGLEELGNQHPADELGPSDDQAIHADISRVARRGRPVQRNLSKNGLKSRFERDFHRLAAWIDYDYDRSNPAGCQLLRFCRYVVVGIYGIGHNKTLAFRLFSGGDALQAVKRPAGAIKRVFDAGRFLQFQEQRVLFAGRAEKANGTRPVDGAAAARLIGGGERNQVTILFSVVVVDMRRTDTRLQQAVGILHAFMHVGMAQIEANV